MNTTNEIKFSDVLKVFALTIGIPIAIFVGFLIIGNIDSYLHRNDWKVKTTPLDESTVNQLCSSLEINSDDKLCNGENRVYGPDFYSAIVKKLKPYHNSEDKSGTAAFDEVEKILGNYQEYCEPVAIDANGFSWFRCIYDIRGDGIYIMGITYSYPDNLVENIMTPMGEDD